MIRIISFLLILAMLFTLSACKKGDNGEDDSTPGNENSEEHYNPSAETLVVPEYKDYGRGSVDFKNLAYSRPDFDSLILAFETVTAKVEANLLSPDELIEAIKSLEDGYEQAESMYTFTEIYVHTDSSVEFWQNEFEYISTAYPSFTKAVEDLLTACARSEHREQFERDYFGYSLEEYADGGIYTDRLVELLEEEASLEAEYSAFSTANVVITYKSVDGTTYSGTADEVLSAMEEKYGSGTSEYKNASIVVRDLYDQRVLSLSTNIFIDLLKVRRLIADELGYESYTDFAYREEKYDYTKEDMRGLLEDVGNYICPIDYELNSVIYSTYFKKNNQPRVSAISIINSLYRAYSKTDADFKDAYSYMLQHGLYDISPEQDNRYSGAFTAYIDTNNSPYLFTTTSGFIKDYISIAHEFGHFYDGFINDGNGTSLDLTEISSQSMQLLTLLMLRSQLRQQEYEYLEYYMLDTVVNNSLLMQSFYAEFEHLVYELEYDEINRNNVTEAVWEAYAKIYQGEMTDTTAIQYVLIPHVILYPHYVESYVVSSITAVEIFSMESYRTGTPGAGITVYKELVERSSLDITLTEALAEAGLSSPFETDTVKKIANCIYFQVLGKNYYSDSKIKAKAA